MDKISEILARPYSRLLVREQDGGFNARVIEFSGCFAEGDTAAEAAQNLETAAEAWVEGALEDGFPIPEPTGETEYSGRFVLRLPRSLHRRCALLAQQEGVSLNQFVVFSLAQQVGEHRAESRIANRIDNALWYAIKNTEAEIKDWNKPSQTYTAEFGSVEQGANDASAVWPPQNQIH